MMPIPTAPPTRPTPAELSLYGRSLGLIGMVGLASLLSLLIALAGCNKGPAYEHTYTVRAVVTALPGDKATDEFRATHERIPDYKSVNGSVGMDVMNMGFPVPDPSVLKGIKVGDKVEITFGDRTTPPLKMGVISIKKLPDDTQLDFGDYGQKKENGSD